ncbi:Uma2 family endonuclease [Trichodesmium erythraeum]|uniref:Uma2 family endonuclease n=1 Tax=Trichodesmium erythraeum TaxID=1206 RepID=UPI0009D74AD5|nr:Uma2 family endonuclease [Trichodesmium erythraeum GBRTRLIN201]MDT9342486.1 Uma2 family endonuclease [Trichodesmium erythraeum 21-75]
MRSYLFWKFGKPPDLVIEIVSPTPGNELGSKLIDYRKLRASYYVVYNQLKNLVKMSCKYFGFVVFYK